MFSSLWETAKNSPLAKPISVAQCEASDKQSLVRGRNISAAGKYKMVLLFIFNPFPVAPLMISMQKEKKTTIYSLYR